MVSILLNGQKFLGHQIFFISQHCLRFFMQLQQYLSKNITENSFSLFTPRISYLLTSETILSKIKQVENFY